jgi:hypothetical protein
MLTIIASHAPDTKVLYNLCLTCKWLCTVAQPLLFSSYEQPVRRGYTSNRLFVHALLDRPDLAAHVKSLSIWDFETRADDEACETWGEWRRSKNREVQSLASDFSNAALDKGERLHFPGLAELMVLLSLTPNVEALCLALPQLSCHVGAAVQEAQKLWGTPQRAVLGRLKSIELGCAHTRGGFCLEQVEHLLRLASSTFLGHNLCEENSVSTWVPLGEPRMLGLRHINLQCSVLDEPAIIGLVKACTALETFELVTADSMVGSWYTANFTAIGAAFEQRANTLESLIIDVETPQTNGTGFLDGTSGHVSLQAMKKLRHVDLPQFALVGEDGLLDSDAESTAGSNAGLDMCDVLPRSLETLVVRQASDGAAAHLASIARHRSARFPALARVNVAFGDEIEDRERVEEALGALDALGVGTDAALLERADHTLFRLCGYR